MYVRAHERTPMMLGTCAYMQMCQTPNKEYNNTRRHIIPTHIVHATSSIRVSKYTPVGDDDREYTCDVETACKEYIK